MKRRHFVFTLKTTDQQDQQDRFCYLFGVAVRFNWIKFAVWPNMAFF